MPPPMISCLRSNDVVTAAEIYLKIHRDMLSLEPGSLPRLYQKLSSFLCKMNQSMRG